MWYKNKVRTALYKPLVLLWLCICGGKLPAVALVSLVMSSELRNISRPTVSGASISTGVRVIVNAF